MNYSHLELSHLQASALFVHDTNNRLLHVNEPDPEVPAPRFFLVRTMSGNIWRTRHDLPADLTTELERLAAREPIAGNTSELREPPYHLSEISELLKEHAPLSSMEAGPAYYLPEPDRTGGTGAVTITQANMTLLEPHYPYARSSYRDLAPVVVRVEVGVAVAICFSARITAQVAEAGVHTVEAYRGARLCSRSGARVGSRHTRKRQGSVIQHILGEHGLTGAGSETWGCPLRC